jgi:hypothetical protein
MAESDPEPVKAAQSPGELFLEPVTGPSFGLAVRLGASAMLAWIAVSFANTPLLGVVAAYGLGVKLGLLAVLFVLLTSYWYFLTGKTTLSAKGVRQDWIWRKSIDWSEVKSARFLGLPGLAWLVPPRLMLRGDSGMYVMFNGGSRSLHQAFARATVAVQARAMGPAASSDTASGSKA